MYMFHIVFHLHYVNRCNSTRIGVFVYLSREENQCNDTAELDVFNNLIHISV